MGIVPTVAEAYEILTRYNKEPFHLKHGKIVAGVMAWFAREYDPANVDFWEAVGMLHDLDFELYPDQHCIQGQILMRELGLDERLVRAAASHGFGITVDIRPEHIMEKILYAADELTGLIGAVALMRPSRSVMDLEVKSVTKKFKTASFAAGCSREVITDGAAMLDWELPVLFERTILAMRSLDPQLIGGTENE